jgi:sugar/nucleoside kinase (ribokinase family)
MKENEARKKREEEARAKAKADEEAAEAARHARRQEEIKGRVYTYGADGKLIYVEAPNPDTLPQPIVKMT